MRRQWHAVRRDGCAAVFCNKITGGRIGEERSDETEDEASQRKGNGIRQDLLIEAGETEIVPIERRCIGAPDQECAAPVGSAENGDDGPGIVDECAGQERHKVESEQPGEQADENHMKAVRRAEGNEHAECEGEGGALGRLLEV